MGEQTGIAWTDSTINVWHGCDKVSAGRKHCYAERSTPVRVKRAAGLEVWGANAARSETKEWEANLRKWNRAEASFQRTGDAGHVHRVFGQSLSDTFEDRRDLDPLRARFFAAIERCPALTFQLLTKRPENIPRMVPPSWLDHWPAHVWIGTTVEDQENADLRIPHLLRVPAAVRFLSVEPQIGPVDLTPWMSAAGPLHPDPEIDAQVLADLADARAADRAAGIVEGWHRGWGPISWVIQGGESGSKARPFDLAWARSLRDQCRAAGVAYFLKQLGARPIYPSAQQDGWKPLRLSDSHGGDESEWPEDLRGCRAFPVSQ